MRKALERIETRLGEAFDPLPDIRLTGRGDALADVRWTEARAVIQVHPSCIDAIRSLWSDALQSRILIDAKGDRITDVEGRPVDEAWLVHLSLTWLVLHELVHLRLGHLEILHVASLAECDVDTKEQSPPGEHWLNELNQEELTLMRPCLELQADNDATEIMFGVYAESEWTRFRIEAAAIFVVMAVMENAEIARKNSVRTYPRVATRFFTLFAQLFQYWLYADSWLEAKDGESFVRTARTPSGKDFERYMKFVLALTVSDVIHIAL